MASVFELHLSVNQRLQEVASHKRSKYYPEEIDMALNKAMFRLLERGVQTRFQDTQIDLGIVSALIQKNRILELIKPGITDPLYEPNIISGYSIIPNDLYWAINHRVEQISNPLNCEVAPTLATASYLEYVAVVKYPTSLPNTYYPALALTSTTQGTLYSAPTELAAGVSTDQGKYVLTTNLLEHFYRNTVVRVYWERYRDTYTRNSFIVVSSNPLGTVSLSSPGLVTTSVVSEQKTYNIYNRAGVVPSTSLEINVNAARVEKSDVLYDSLKNNRYYAPSPKEAVINQTLDYFIVYGEESSLITRMYTDYIRKPRTISLSLSQTCELADTAHNKLVDLAVEILRLDTKDPAYPSTVQDTELRA